jgi:hypothetical protein
VRCGYQATGDMVECLSQGPRLESRSGGRGAIFHRMLGVLDTH